MKQNLKNALGTIIGSIALGIILWLLLTMLGVFK